MKRLSFLVVRIVLLLPLFFLSHISSSQQTLGEGMVKPRIEAGTTLYLWSGELIDDLLHHAAVKDSVTLKSGQYHTEIGTAPPWFMPELVKFDYDLFLLRAVSISRNWIEVVVNSQTGRTAWVDRHTVEFVSWPEFLLTVFSVELINPAVNPMRLKPLDNAAIVARPGQNSLSVFAVKGDWIKVALPGDKPGTRPVLGWIRWKKGSQMLITYSPLS